ncbi:family 43 glycosylhydrolase [[Clostridium] polysaccharolyticum]|uniref:Ricin-type beta-trefoil lectin domain-like n=1 Tax=[Clostridium] polysaccharolyticum TaxID=29364 RepID=A0A1I0BEZ4_9FIRM|nr:family 43 glycosylhydrolase [[Clostridium] polysaccharolyticum]SET05140.1 Ricin-type beta-trefoil lectin domain-like [[Clostridium] polysaccharolyticum]
MRKQWNKTIAAVAAIPLLVGGGIGVNTAAVQAQNPIVQTLYTADPAPMVYKDTLYLYTSHDEDGASYYEMNDWRCYKTTDMVNWVDCGSPMGYKTFSWAKGDAWAGQCIERNGKFYYYVPVAANGGTAIGVGVSDSPEGPFKDAIGKPLVGPGYGNIDPTVYIDNDGQAYLYWGNPALKYVKLNSNMTSYTGGVQTVNLTTQSFGQRNGNPDRKTLFEEGPWFYRRGNLYYMVYAASGIPENICYSTSTSPTGPWTFRGVIMPSGGGSFTNHPGIVDYQGHSYFFYHNGQLPGGNGFQRSVAVEEFTYKSDGSIPQISMSKNGPAQLKYLNPYVLNEAETICYESGVETEKCGEGTQNVSYIENGDYIMVKGVDFGSGAKSFEARVASATSGGNIEIRLDSATGKLVGTCPVPSTGDWQKYVTKTCSISGATGTHDLYFRFTGGSGSLFNFNWWKFTSESGTVPSAAPSVAPSTAPSTAPQPSATPSLGFEEAKVADGWYYIKGVDSQKYLQVKDNTGENAVNVEIGTSSGKAGQKWYVTNQEDGTITLKSGLGSFNLDIGMNENKDGANVHIYSAWNGQSQKYKLQKTSNANTYVIRTSTSDYERAIDVYEIGKTDGSNVCQWLYNGNKNQQWVFEPVEAAPAPSTAPSKAPEPSAAPSQAPSAEPSPQPSKEPEASTGISFEYSVVSDWGNGYQGQIVVTNKSGKTLNGWTLTMDCANAIQSLWGADLADQTGNKVTIKSPSWASSFASGTSVTINFVANGSSNNKPSDYVLK